MNFSSPIFQNGAQSACETGNWAEGLFEAMAIAKARRVSADGNTLVTSFPCDADTLRKARATLTDAAKLIPAMLAAAGTAVALLDDAPANTMKELGWLIAGVCSLLEDIQHDAEWMADGEACPDLLQEQGDPIPWFGMEAPGSEAAIEECRATSQGSSVKAGARFGRFMMQRLKATEGGESTGPGDDECEPFDYQSMAFQIQGCFAAAVREAKTDIDFMFGFTMALATYLNPGLSGSTVGTEDITRWDPVEELARAGICAPDLPAPAKAPKASKPRKVAEHAH